MNDRKQFKIIALIILAIVAACLFYQSFLPGLVLRANDIPLAAASARHFKDIGSMPGDWNDLNWFGIANGARPLALNTFSLFILGPIGQAKFAGMLALLLVGLSAKWCFSQMKLSPTASLIGALALMLNMLFFSFSAWGVYLWNFALAFFAVALALIHQGRNRAKDLVGIGLCAGMCVNEGIDVGAILTIIIGIYFVFRNWSLSVKNLLHTVLRFAVIVIIAVLVSVSWVSSLVQTNISGVAKTKVNKEEKQEQWLFTTQWSLPKKEAATFLVPGLFGYRMDTPEGGNYWGEIGRDPHWQPGSGGFSRYTGSGQYAGKAVLLLALVAALWAFLPKSKQPNLSGAPSFQRREVIFWTIVCAISLSLAFGKHFFTYAFIYPLPFFNTMRNPVKFLPIVMVALVILSVHGLDLFTQRIDQLRSKLLGKITLGVSAVLIILNLALLVGWSKGEKKLFSYLAENEFPASSAQSILQFGQHEIVISLFLLLLTVGAVFFFLRGQNKTVAMIALGAVLVVDLGRSDVFWKDYYNYQKRYESNSIIDFLRQSPEEHRVAGPKMGNGPFYLLALQNPSGDWQQFVQGVSSLYDVEWLQHLFQYYNIQSADIIQWPRMPIMDGKFASIFRPRVTPPSSVYLNLQPRFWQLTSTRYILASAAAADALNNAFGPTNHFNVLKTFGVGRNDQYYTAVESSNGPLALLEFTNALPRVGFYSQWRTEPDEDKALQIIASPEFDPAKEVLVVGKDIPGIKATGANTASETRLISYAPRKSAIAVTNAAPGVLLINSRYDSTWHIRVDGKQQPLLRCNFLMCGVALPAGKHEVVFQYEPDTRLFFANVAVLIALIGFLIVPFKKKTVAEKSVEKVG